MSSHVSPADCRIDGDNQPLVHPRRQTARLALGEFIPYQLQAVDAAVKPLGEACEHGRLSCILLKVKLADDVVALLADGDQLFKTLLTKAALPWVH